MPVHDWTRVSDGIFHSFHLSWTDEIMAALNAGLLPSDYYALRGLAELKYLFGGRQIVFRFFYPLPKDSIHDHGKPPHFGIASLASGFHHVVQELLQLPYPLIVFKQDPVSAQDFGPNHFPITGIRTQPHGKLAIFLRTLSHAV
jgi:hypothetical protein